MASLNTEVKMKPITSIGECMISTADKDFFFKPSLINMTSIGSEEEIVGIYSTLNGFEINRVISSSIERFGTIPECILKAVNKPAYGRQVLNAAILVMQSCCDEDISSLVGSYRPSNRGMVYVPGGMPISHIVIIAKRLAEHGIIGKHPKQEMTAVEEAKAKSRKDEYTSAFIVNDYLNTARVHLDMTRAEAEQLTMTELQGLLATKYPPSNKGMTRAELIADSEAFEKEWLEAQKNG